MQGIQNQVLKSIGIWKGIKEEDIALVLQVPLRYINEICQSLLSEGYIMNTVSQGYALAIEIRIEVLRLIEKLRLVYEEEMSKRLSIPEESAAQICEDLLKEGYLSRTPRGGYILKKDKELALNVVKKLKEASFQKVAQNLKISPQHAEFLCGSLAEDFLLLKSPEGKYLPPERDVTRVLKLVKEYGWAPINRIVYKMKITPAYADLLCRSLVKQGYLKKVEKKQAYTLVGKQDE